MRRDRLVEKLQRFNSRLREEATCELGKVSNSWTFQLTPP